MGYINSKFSADQPDPHFKRSESMNWSSSCGCLGGNRERSVVASCPSSLPGMGYSNHHGTQFYMEHIHIIPHILYIQCVYIYIFLICVCMGYIAWHWFSKHSTRWWHVKRDNQSLVVDDFMVTRWDGEFMPNGMVNVWPTGWCPP